MYDYSVRAITEPDPPIHLDHRIRKLINNDNATTEALEHQENNNKH